VGGFGAMRACSFNTFILLDDDPVTVRWTAGDKTMANPPRVLIVEDEPNIRELVSLHLGLEGYACEGVGDGRSALGRVEAERFDLLVLDLMIPGVDGLALCRAVRNGRLNQDVPILMLTARREESDKVVGLESGADDYLTKFGVWGAGTQPCSLGCGRKVVVPSLDGDGRQAIHARAGG
jgi:CheY-like chemotaxis protein